jgi:23S rRNA pseudouridine1911/1915/1917 synthase
VRIEAPRPLLHARELGFEHPRTGRAASFTLDPPDDFMAALEKLRARSTGGASA